MGFYIIAALGVVGYLIYYFVEHRRRRWELNILEIPAREFNLEIKRKKFLYPGATGCVNGYNVILEFDESVIPVSLMILMKFKVSIEGSLQITRETLLSHLQKDMLSGDRSFDDEMLIKSSDPVTAAAFLSHEARHAIMELNHISLKISITDLSGAVHIDPSAENIIEIIRFCIMRLTDLARMFSASNDIKHRLLENIVREPTDVPKMKNMALLMERFSMDGEIRLLYKKLLLNGSVKVRIEAARHLGVAGVNHLLGILEEDGIGEEDLMMCIGIVGGARCLKAIPALMRVYANAGSAIRIEIINAFRSMRDAALCDFLLEQALGAEGDLRLAAIKALGSCGTVEAVEPLLNLEKSSLNPIFRYDVQKAVAEIQSRLEGADAGWLSVAGLADREGSLSLDDRAGGGSLSAPGGKKGGGS